MVAKKNKIKKGKDKDNIYISLQEATKYCNYSQEYLSLRARQGKLKSKKIGRDWMTTREWLESYIQSHHDFKKIPRVKKSKTGRPLIVVQYKSSQAPENLPVEKKPIRRTNLTAIIILVLFLATGVFGAPGLMNVFKKIPATIQEFSQSFDRGLSSLNSPNGYSYITADIVDLFESYRQSVGRSFKSNYSTVTDSLKNPQEIPDIVFQKYQALNGIIKKQISLSGQNTKDLFSGLFSKAVQFGKLVLSPWLEKPQLENYDISAFWKEIEKIKEEGLQVKEVSKITKIEPIK